MFSGREWLLLLWFFSGYGNNSRMIAIARRGDLSALRSAGSSAVAARGTTLCREGQKAGHLSYISSGFCAAVKHTADGREQNIALYVPGDVVDHEGYTFGSSRCDIVALTEVAYRRIGHEVLEEHFNDNSAAKESFWRHVAFHGVLAQEWLLNIGQRPAYARTAHLLCEIIHRTCPLHESEKFDCALPLTQTELANMLGLSVVHVNRTLMRLRMEKLIHLRRGRMEVLNWSGLTQAAGFEPGYLRAVA